MEKKYESLPDLPGMDRVQLPKDIRIAMLSYVTVNPYAGAKAKFLGKQLPGEFTLGEFMVPCPCCGDMLVGLQELPGLFPGNALLIETEDDDDD